jgi:hypothetical protein
MRVPDDYRFTVNGQQMSVHDLRAGMKGTATITTRTTVTPVTVTEVKNGTVAVASGGSIIVRTDQGVRSFTQSEVDKRGVKIFRDGKAVQLSELNAGDRLSATIVTTQPPRVVTEREVQAALNPAAPAAVPESTRAAATLPPGAAAPLAPRAAPNQSPRTLPETASEWPLVATASAVMLALGFVLTLRRRVSR